MLIARSVNQGQLACSPHVVSGMRLLAIVCLLLIHNLAAADTIKIGLRALHGVARGLEQWQPTADYLSQQIPGHKFVVVPYVGLQQQMDAASEGDFDFVFNNPSSSIEMVIRYGVSPLVTLVNKRQGKPYTRFGSVIFTTADNQQINSISDLKGKSFIAISERAFGGWRVGWREMLKHDIDPYRDFSFLEFNGGIQEDVVHSVLNGNFDAGIVRTDMLERMAARGDIDLDSIKVINPQTVKDFPFFLSSELYPEWPFSKMKHTPNKLAQQVSLALLTMPKNHPAARAGNYVGWTVPEDYQPVHQLMKDLRVGPYENYGTPELAQLIKDNRAWVTSGLIFVIALVFAAIYIASINRKLANEKQRQQKTNTDLHLRVNELHCLYTVSNILADTKHIDLGLSRIVAVLPKSFKLPKYISARIHYRNQEFHTSDFSESQWKLEADITEVDKPVGKLEIYYHGSHDNNEESPFLLEEEALIEEIASKISIFLDGVYASKVMHDTNTRLEEYVNDRTKELVLQKEKAEKASAAKTEFLSKMSHELRTPLNAILGFSQLILLDNENRAGDSHFNYAREIDAAGQHLLGLINEILDLSRIESGNYGVLIEETSLDGVIRESAALVQSIADTRNISLKIETEIDAETIFTDKIALKQILINLLSNAVKYSHPNHPVTLRVEENINNTVTFSVIDSGPGIPDNKRELLFKPFERLGQDPSIDGVGIGLSVVKGLSEALKGTSGVESIIGQGSCFWCTVPNVPADRLRAINS